MLQLFPRDSPRSRIPEVVCYCLRPGLSRWCLLVSGLLLSDGIFAIFRIFCWFLESFQIFLVAVVVDFLVTKGIVSQHVYLVTVFFLAQWTSERSGVWQFGEQMMSKVITDVVSHLLPVIKRFPAVSTPAWK